MTQLDAIKQAFRLFYRSGYNRTQAFEHMRQHKVAAAFIRKIDGPYEDLIKPHLKSGQVCIVTNSTVAPLYLDKVKAALTRDSGGECNTR